MDGGKTGLTYAEAGVDIERGDALVDRIVQLAAATHDGNVMGGIGGFGALYRLPAMGPAGAHLVACTDGVGTKLKIAFLTGIHDTVGIDLVAMNVNDLIATGGTPMFFLDYFATGRLDLGTAERVIAGIAEGCRQGRCALIGGETAEMPGFYPDGEYDLAGFAVGIVTPDRTLDPATIVPGDAVIGLASTGLHSNGYSLARRALFDTAGMTVETPVAEYGQPLGRVLLEPTRIYVAALEAARREAAVKGAAHITGSGIPGNLPRVLNDKVDARISMAAVPRQPIFDLIQRAGGIDEQEMRRTFNLGAGMIAIVEPGSADALVRTMAAHGIAAFPIGEIVAGEGDVRFVD